MPKRSIRKLSFNKNFLGFTKVSDNVKITDYKIKKSQNNWKVLIIADPKKFVPALVNNGQTLIDNKVHMKDF